MLLLMQRGHRCPSREGSPGQEVLGGRTRRQQRPKETQTLVLAAVTRGHAASRYLLLASTGRHMKKVGNSSNLG